MYIQSSDNHGQRKVQKCQEEVKETKIGGEGSGIDTVRGFPVVEATCVNKRLSITG
jgi:hypothetical protein